MHFRFLIPSYLFVISFVYGLSRCMIASLSGIKLASNRGEIWGGKTHLHMKIFAFIGKDSFYWFTCCWNVPDYKLLLTTIHGQGKCDYKIPGLEKPYNMLSSWNRATLLKLRDCSSLTEKTEFLLTKNEKVNGFREAKT